MKLPALASAVSGKPWFWPALAFALGLAVILPGLGSHGFWEPDEIELIEGARELAREGEDAPPGEGAPETAEGEAAEDETAEDAPDEGDDSEAADAEADEATFAERSAAAGIAALGMSERAARAPSALFALLALAATILLGWRVAGPRAGAIAGAVLVSFPLFAVPARLVLGDVATVCGHALIALGAVGLCFPAEGPPARRAVTGAADAAALVAGGLLATAETGALAGLAAPLAALAGAAWIFFLGERRAGESSADATPAPGRLVGGADATPAPRRLVGGAIALTTAAACALGWVALEAFDPVPAYPGDRAVFGITLVPAEGAIDALGGAWRDDADLGATFDTLFETIAYGLFPFSALAPVALVAPALTRARGRRAFGALACLAWAAAAWATATLLSRDVGPAHFPALSAVAVGVGIFLDDLVAAHDAPEGDRAARLSPLAAVFAIAAAIVLARDILRFPDIFTGLPIPGRAIGAPEGVEAALAIFVVLGGLVMATLALPLHGWRPSRGSRLALLRPLTGRRGVAAALALSAACAGFLAHGYTPAVSSAISSKALFDRVAEAGEGDEPIAVLGSPLAGHELYADGELEVLSDRGELVDFFTEGRHAFTVIGGEGEHAFAVIWREARHAFAVIGRDHLCPVQEMASRQGVEYYVLYDENADYLLLSNRLGEGRSDRNPLAGQIVHRRPRDIDVETDVVFDDRIRLIGYDMPRRVSRGDTFEMTLYYEVISGLSGAWDIFVHFDRGGQRFHGDHEPLEGVCETRHWQESDYIVDRFEVSAGGAGHPRGEHEVWTGFFRGSDGNWTNLPVSEPGDAEVDESDRVRLRALEVE